MHSQHTSRRQLPISGKWEAPIEGKATSAADGSALLTRVGWLSETSPEFQKGLLGSALWRTVEPGYVFNRAGDEQAGIWGIASGQINLTSGLGVSDSPIADVQLPGSWGGFGPIFLGRRAANAEPAIPSLLAFVHRTVLLGMLEQRPSWWMFMGRLSTLHTFRYGSAVGDLLISDARLRLVAVLLRLADCRHRNSALGLPIRLRLTQKQLADCANVSRQLVGPALHELEGMGAITIGYREIIIRKAERMRKLLDDS